MRGLLSTHVPTLNRVLVIDSGRQQTAALFLTTIYPELQEADLFTCFPSPPSSFDPSRGRIFAVHDVRGNAGRNHFFHQLKSAEYSAVCLLCTGDKIMTKWKWLTALSLPVKVMLVDERASAIWLDIAHWRPLLGLISRRAGLERFGILRRLGDLLLYPFSLLFLACYGIYIYALRAMRRQGTAR